MHLIGLVLFTVGLLAASSGRMTSAEGNIRRGGENAMDIQVTMEERKGGMGGGGGGRGGGGGGGRSGRSGFSYYGHGGGGATVGGLSDANRHRHVPTTNYRGEKEKSGLEKFFSFGWL